MWYIYTKEYYSAMKKNKIMPFAATCKDLEIVILSEVSQTQNNEYHMISLIYVIKNWCKWTYLQNACGVTDVENQLMVTRGERKGLIKAIYCHTAFFKLIFRVHYAKCWTGWIASWNQDCKKKYQQPQISRWYHSNGRKQRETKKPLDEDVTREWKELASNSTFKKLTSWHLAP